MLIGTHRILSQDIVFDRLGLLVVDEEHRFGVRHKERIKELKHEVNVLTLTATLIQNSAYGDRRYERFKHHSNASRCPFRN